MLDITKLTVLLFFIVSLLACTNIQDNDTPEFFFNTMVKNIKENNVDGYYVHLYSNADLEKYKKDFGMEKMAPTAIGGLRVIAMSQYSFKYVEYSTNKLHAVIFYEVKTNYDRKEKVFKRKLRIKKEENRWVTDVEQMRKNERSDLESS